jgi:3-phosphoshikimate 1-carboxyvinyltransferase
MAAELRKLGAAVMEGEDFIEVHPPRQWQAGSIKTYDDHRVAMCFSLAAFNPLTVPQPATPMPVRILDPRCVGKTFPDYFETLFSVASTELTNIPVLTIDGPTASGKGTIASEVARALGYGLLDSGAIYRATALQALRAGMAADDAAGLARLAAALPLRFENKRTWLDAEDVTEELRREDVGALASKVSAHPEVRTALHSRQLAFRRLPGLVADGRDMGTALFPKADLKVFLTASVATRAERRHKQLISKGISANISDLLQQMQERDERDRNRSASPLKPADDALLLDNSAHTIEASVAQVLAWWEERRPF